MAHMHLEGSALSRLTGEVFWGQLLAAHKVGLVLVLAVKELMGQAQLE